MNGRLFEVDYRHINTERYPDVYTSPPIWADDADDAGKQFITQARLAHPQCRLLLVVVDVRPIPTDR